MAERPKVAALDTGTTEVASLLVVDGDVAAGGPDALAAQFLGGAKGVAVAGATIADGVEPAGPPLTVGGVHEAFSIRPADQFFGLVAGQGPPKTPVKGLQGAIVEPDAGLDGPVAVLTQAPAVAGLDDDVGGGVDHLFDLAEEQDGIVGQGILGFEAPHLALDVGPVPGDELVEETAIDHPAVLGRDVVPVLILGKVVETMVKGPGSVGGGTRLHRLVDDAAGVAALQEVPRLLARDP